MFAHGELSLAQIAVRVLTSGGLVPWNSPCGVNCSYAVSFLGPAYQCDELGPLATAPVNVTQLFREGWNTGVQPLPFLNESVLWLGLDDYGNATTPTKLWLFYAQLNSTVRCTLYSATYNASITYTNNIQSVETEVVLHAPIVNGEELYNAIGTPFDVSQFAIHESIVACLGGWFALEPSAFYLYSMAPLWAGVASYSNETLISYPDDLSVKVEDFMKNVTTSLIYLQEDPDPEVAAMIAKVNVPGTVVTVPPVYTYTKHVLWEIYGAALGTSLGCIFLGACMLFYNRSTGQLSFSEVLLATRNPTLDRISETDDAQSFNKTALRYGKLEGNGRVCFGVPEEIVTSVPQDRAGTA